MKVGRVLAIPIMAPFKEIAMHIIQSPGIREFLSYPVGLSSGISTVPAHFVQHSIEAAKKFDDLAI